MHIRRCHHSRYDFSSHESTASADLFVCRCTMYHSGLRTQQSVKTLGTIIRAMMEAKEMRMQKAKEIMRSASMLLLLSST